jgi:uncharacterized protein YeaO (DUF488 family)
MSRRLPGPGVKRASDGTRVLVGRIWPRGLTKEHASVDVWLKDIAPSAGLRTWLGHDPNRWREFQKRYCEELRADAQVVVCEDFVAGLLLDLVMAPADERLLVPPVRKRKDPALAGQALVADVVDEALDLFQLGAQHLGVVEVVIPLLFIGEDLENH